MTVVLTRDIYETLCILHKPAHVTGPYYVNILALTMLIVKSEAHKNIDLSLPEAR